MSPGHLQDFALYSTAGYGPHQLLEKKYVCLISRIVTLTSTRHTKDLQRVADTQEGGGEPEDVVSTRYRPLRYTPSRVISHATNRAHNEL